MLDGSCSSGKRLAGCRSPFALLGLAIAVVSAPLLATDVQLVSGRALEGSVDVALCPDGSFLVSWVSNPPPFVGFQHFDAEGAALSPPVPFGDITTWGTETRVGCDANNEALALWTRFGNDYAGVTSGMYVTAFSSSGSRLWPTIDLGNAVVPGAVLFLGVDMTASPAGGWIVHWSARINGSQTLREFSQRILTASGPVGEAFEWTDPPHASSLASAPNTALQVFERLDPQQSRLFAQRLLPDGSPAAPAREVYALERQDGLVFYGDKPAGFAGDRYFHLVSVGTVGSDPIGDPGFVTQLQGLTTVGDQLAVTPFPIREVETGDIRGSVAVDAQGRAIVAWGEAAVVLGPLVGRIQAFGANGSPLSEVVALNDLPTTLMVMPLSAISPSGRWIVVWGESGEFGANPGLRARFGSFPSGCTPSAEVLCLAGNRFRVTAIYHDHLGRDGVGQAVALTPESGTFWFFTAANVELILKVVDACLHPDFQDFWVYASGLTDVAVKLTVVDTWTGESWERETALGEPFPPVLDSQAFHTCGTTSPIISLAAGAP